MLHRASTSVTFEGIMRTSENEILASQEPVKDAHDAHVVEKNGEAIKLFGHSEVKLHLEGAIMLQDGILVRRAQDVRENVGADICWIICNMKPFQ
jgi:hypothetical protein